MEWAAFDYRGFSFWVGRLGTPLRGSINGDDFGFCPVVTEAQAGAGVATAGEENEAFDNADKGNGQENIAGGACDPVSGKGRAIFFDGFGLHDLLAGALTFEHGEAVSGEEDQANREPLQDA